METGPVFTPRCSVDDCNELLQNVAAAINTDVIQFKDLRDMRVLAYQIIDGEKYLLGNNVDYASALIATFATMLQHGMNDTDIQGKTERFYRVLVNFWKQHNLEPFCFYGVFTVDEYQPECYYIARLDKSEWDNNPSDWAQLIQDKCHDKYMWVGIEDSAPFFTDALTLLRNYARIITEIIIGNVEFTYADNKVTLNPVID